MSDYARHAADRPGPVQQQACACGAKPATATHAPPESEKLHQLKADLADSPQVSRLEGLTALLNGPRGVAQRIAPAPGFGGSGLPDGLRAGVEALSGVSMRGVAVHYNSPQPAQLNALAHAQDDQVHLGPGQEAHLPHEAWHVVQQRQGRVRPTMQFAGTPINDDEALEREADAMGAKAMQMRADPSAAPATPAPTGTAVVQRAIGDDGDGRRVKEISTGETYLAKRSDKKYYDLYQNDTFIMYATPYDPDFELVDEQFDESEEEEDVEEALLDPDQTYTFTFTLNPTIKKQVKKRASALNPDRAYVAEANAPDYLKMLYSVRLKAKQARNSETYARGSKQGDTMPEETYLGTKISIRLDKIVNKNTSVNPRVSRTDQPDKTTQELVELIDAYEDDDRDAFLAGFRGEALGEDMNEAAYSDGVEARATVLISDVVDYPGNSVITDRLLANVEDADDYIRLFTGTRSGEYSYGALPSQNRATVVEDNLERKGPFKDVGTLISKGTLTVSSATSNVPTLRKLKSLVDADSKLVTITATVGRKKSAKSFDVPTEDFSDYAAVQAMKSRDKKSKIAANEGLMIFSEGESDTDDEMTRISGLSESHREARQEDMERQFAILAHKLRASRRVVGAKQKRQEREEEADD